MARIVRERRKMFFILGILWLIFGHFSSSQAVVDRVVAIVNQEIITLSELEKATVHLKGEIEVGNRLEKSVRRNELSRMALEQLIEEMLIDQEARKSGIKVTGKEIDGAIEEIKRRNRVTQEGLETALARDGLTLTAFRKEIEKKILRNKTVQWAIKLETNVEEKELRDFYMKNKDRYRTEVSYRPGHILFRVPREATSGEVRKIRAACQKVLAKIKAGEDFGEMALIYSEDVSSKDRGDLGNFKKGELLPALEKEILGLKVGEVSGIVRTDFGFHIICLLDRKGGDPIPFEEVKERIRIDYLDEKFEKALKQFITTIREKSVIEIKL